MFKRNLIISNTDYGILIKMVKELLQIKTERDSLYILGKRLQTATKLFPQDIPSNIVTLDSVVSFKNLTTVQDYTYKLVVPSGAEIDRNMISVFSPVGTALLGALTGEIISCRVPAGKIEIRVENILYQPERDKQEIA